MAFSGCTVWLLQWTVTGDMLIAVDSCSFLVFGLAWFSDGVVMAVKVAGCPPMTGVARMANEEVNYWSWMVGPMAESASIFSDPVMLMVTFASGLAGMVQCAWWLINWRQLDSSIYIWLMDLALSDNDDWWISRTGMAMIVLGRSPLSMVGWWVCWLSMLFLQGSGDAMWWLLHQWLAGMVWRRALPCELMIWLPSGSGCPLPFQGVSQWDLWNKESRATPSLPTFPILAPVPSAKIWTNINTKYLMNNKGCSFFNFCSSGGDPGWWLLMMAWLVLH